MRASDERHQRIVIIGAGPGGLCMAIKLKEAGFEDVVILERAAAPGGTWQHNRYPGAACDVQSHLYSFSFEQKKDWTTPFATQPEILEYLQHCVATYGLEANLRLNTGVRGAYWDEECLIWRLVTESGEEIEADVVVSALGMFNTPSWPDIPGLDSFGGTVFHTARWDEDHDLAGETVAVIGTAASAVQSIPEIAPRVAQLYVFQRTANWVLPKRETFFTEERLEELRHDPMAARQLRWQIFRTVDGVITFSNPAALQAAEEAGMANLAAVEDPEVRRKLTPVGPWGSKRPLSSDVFYPTFNRPNVELVTEAIQKVTADAIVTADGKERRVDTIVLATGFATTRYLSAIDVTGRGGLNLEEAWAGDPRAYLGITTSGFPNLFMLYGPNTNNGSIIFMIESQVSYILRQLRRMRDEGIVWMDVRGDVMDAYNEALQRDLDQVGVWQTGVSGYYRGASGRIVTQWPHTMDEYRRRTMRPDPDAFEIYPGPNPRD